MKTASFRTLSLNAHLFYRPVQLLAQRQRQAALPGVVWLQPSKAVLAASSLAACKHASQKTRGTGALTSAACAVGASAGPCGVAERLHRLQLALLSRLARECSHLETVR